MFVYELSGCGFESSCSDIFALFSSTDHADKFKEYLSSKHPNINFSIEKEKDGCLPFSDVNIFLENEKFATNVYRKKTFSDVYTNFKSFIPETYEIGLIKSLLFRCFSLCSDFIKFHHEIDKLKSILYKNSYPHVQFVFQTKCKISNFLTFKDKIPLVLRSGIVSVQISVQ